MKNIFTLIVVSILVVACASSGVEKFYSGFLGDHYAKLQPAISASGQPVMRWISPTLTERTYHQIMIDPTRFYPLPKTSQQLYTSTLKQILDYMDASLYQYLGLKNAVVSPLTNTPLENTLRLSVAISGVSAEEDAFRDRAAIAVEYKITDAVSGEVLVAGVRKGFGESLSGEITLESLKPVMDGWAKDAAAFSMTQ